jgi:hypothetical protein
MSSKALTSWLSSHSEHFRLLDSGKVHFIPSQLDFPGNLDVLNSFVAGKAYQRALKAADQVKDEDLPAISPYLVPHSTHSTRVYCRLTKVTLNRSRSELVSHLYGKSFVKANNKRQQKEERKKLKEEAKKKKEQRKDGIEEILERAPEEFFEGEEEEEEDQEEEEEEEEDMQEESSVDLLSEDDSADEFYVRKGEYNRKPVGENQDEEEEQEEEEMEESSSDPPLPAARTSKRKSTEEKPSKPVDSKQNSKQRKLK